MKKKLLWQSIGKYLIFWILIFNDIDDFSNFKSQLVNIFSLVLVTGLHFVEHSWR